MDWARAIEINRDALTRIVAALVAMIGLQGDGSVKRLPRPVYQLAMRVLRPAESAVRRLIIVVARGLVAEPLPGRLKSQAFAPKTKEAPARTGSGVRRHSFRLFDTRKLPGEIDWDEYDPTHVDMAVVDPASGPRIRVVGDRDPFSPLSLVSLTVPKHVDDDVDATRLGRRFMALKGALENLPHQARRMVRWRARRALLINPKFISPLRPGPPPGHRKRPREEIDWVLKECHALARDVLNNDTS